MKFKLFNLDKDGKGVEKDEDTTPNVGYYFKSLWRKLTKLLSINLLAILQFVPLAVAFFTYFWAETTPTITDLSFPLLSGVSLIDPSPANQILLMLSSPQLNIPVLSLGVVLTIVGMMLLFALIFGWCNVGFTYLMRELVNGRPIFIFSDLKHAIKRNAKQGFFMGLIDFAIIFILGYNIYNMGSGATANFIGEFFYVANVAIAIIYIIMRFYIYLMMITFDMKITKILKNALIFIMLGIKRNLLAILWIVILVALNVFLFVIYTPLGLILPLFYIVAIPMFTTTYAAYPVIKRYMIDPSPYADAASTDDAGAKDTVFSDDTGITADEMWKMFTEQENIHDAEYKAWAFSGDADSLADMAVRGFKTATSSAHPLYAVKNEPLPRVGEYNIILNSKNHAVCVTQTTKVYVLPFNKMTEEHAELEGEGDKSLKYWTKAHKEVFTKELEKAGLTFREDMRVVCEQFKAVYKPE